MDNSSINGPHSLIVVRVLPNMCKCTIASSVLTTSRIVYDLFDIDITILHYMILYYYTYYYYYIFMTGTDKTRKRQEKVLISRLLHTFG